MKIFFSTFLIVQTSHAFWPERSPSVDPGLMCSIYDKGTEYRMTAASPSGRTINKVANRKLSMLKGSRRLQGGPLFTSNSSDTCSPARNHNGTPLKCKIVNIDSAYGPGKMVVYYGSDGSNAVLGVSCPEVTAPPRDKATWCAVGVGNGMSSRGKSSRVIFAARESQGYEGLNGKTFLVRNQPKTSPEQFATDLSAETESLGGTSYQTAFMTIPNSFLTNDLGMNLANLPIVAAFGELTTGGTMTYHQWAGRMVSFVNV